MVLLVCLDKSITVGIGSKWPFCLDNMTRLADFLGEVVGPDITMTMVVFGARDLLTAHLQTDSLFRFVCSLPAQEDDGEIVE